MGDWDEVVTTALLGTDRRPQLSAQALLDDAARHRAVARAAPPLERCAAPPAAPEADRPWAPRPAQLLLGELLGRPVAELVNGWLAAAVAYGVLAAPEHWTPLAALAATRPDYDRLLLGQALGAPGRWFLSQNPAWLRLAEAVARASTTPPQPPVDPTRGAGPLPGAAEVRARPEAVLALAAPWPRSVTVAALQVVLGGQLGWRASAYAATIGARLDPADADLLQQARDAVPPPGRGAPAGVRTVLDALAAAERSATARAEIDRAFAPPGGLPGPLPASTSTEGLP